VLERLGIPPADPLLALAGLVRMDARPRKIDLGIGVFRDEGGQTPVMRAVAEAERRLLAERTTKAYVGARGDAVFADRMTEIVLGEPRSQKVAAVQATGGTGALRILAGLIARSRRDATVWLPDPTWLNHHTIFSDAGLRTATYPYYDRQSSWLRIAAMCDAMKGIPSGDVVLFHGCCHNPCGEDLSHIDWEAVAELVVRRGIVPLVDLAYQGFGSGLDEDAYGVRLLASRAPELLVASSCSKNFGIYSERTGCALVLSETASIARLAESHMALVARPLYSMPPDHGSAIVRTVLQDETLASLWRTELEAVRLSMVSKRGQLAAEFRAMSGGSKFDYLETQMGMFSMLQLSREQIDIIRRLHGVYVVEDGRINVAGLQSDRVSEFVRIILEVL
jgi:aspartate/tyrosine/aromatic aminotransferase